MTCCRLWHGTHTAGCCTRGLGPTAASACPPTSTLLCGVTRFRYARALAGRATLAEQLADIDDDFAELVLDDDYSAKDLDPSAIKQALRAATLAGEAMPLLCGTARRNKGIQPLLDAIVNFLPSPLDRPPVELLLTPSGGSGSGRVGGRGGGGGKGKGGKDGATIRLPPSAEGPFCALAFKVVYDSFAGAMVFLRVYSGTLKNGAVLFNATRGVKERVNRLMVVHADDHEQIDQVGAWVCAC
jgi:elongation factor G